MSIYGPWDLRRTARSTPDGPLCKDRSPAHNLVRRTAHTAMWKTQGVLFRGDAPAGAGRPGVDDSRAAARPLFSGGRKAASIIQGRREA